MQLSWVLRKHLVVGQFREEGGGGSSFYYHTGSKFTETGIITGSDLAVRAVQNCNSHDAHSIMTIAVFFFKILEQSLQFEKMQYCLYFYMIILLDARTEPGIAQPR